MGPEAPKFSLLHRGGSADLLDAGSHLSSLISTSGSPVTREALKDYFSTRPSELVVRVDVPKVELASEIVLDVSDRQLQLFYKDVYALTVPLPFAVDTNGVAKFSKKTQQMSVTLRVLPPTQEEVATAAAKLQQAHDKIEEGKAARYATEVSEEPPVPEASVPAASAAEPAIVPADGPPLPSITPTAEASDVADRTGSDTNSEGSGTPSSDDGSSKSGRRRKSVRFNLELDVAPPILSRAAVASQALTAAQEAGFVLDGKRKAKGNSPAFHYVQKEDSFILKFAIHDVRADSVEIKIDEASSDSPTMEVNFTTLQARAPSHVVLRLAGAVDASHTTHDVSSKNMTLRIAKAVPAYWPDLVKNSTPSRKLSDRTPSPASSPMLTPTAEPSALSLASDVSEPATNTSPLVQIVADTADVVVDEPAPVAPVTTKTPEVVIDLPVLPDMLRSPARARVSTEAAVTAPLPLFDSFSSGLQLELD